MSRRKYRRRLRDIVRVNSSMSGILMKSWTSLHGPWLLIHAWNYTRRKVFLEHDTSLKLDECRSGPRSMSGILCGHTGPKFRVTLTPFHLRVEMVDRRNRSAVAYWTPRNASTDLRPGREMTIACNWPPAVSTTRGLICFVGGRPKSWLTSENSSNSETVTWHIVRCSFSPEIINDSKILIV